MALQSTSPRSLSGVGLSLRSLPLTRRTIALGIAFCVAIVYCGPYIFRILFSYLDADSRLDSCLSKHLKNHKFAIARYDASIKHETRAAMGDQHSPLLFVGNGKLGAVAEDSASLHIFYDAPISQTPSKGSGIVKRELRAFRLPFKPILKATYKLPSDAIATASVLNYREGIVEKISCLRTSEPLGFIFVNHTVIAHRSRPNVFLQHLEMSSDELPNASEFFNINIVENRVGSGLRKVSKMTAAPKSYKLYSGVFEVAEGKFMALTIASRRITNGLQMMGNTESHVDSVTVVVQSQIRPTKELAMREELNTQKRASEEASIVMTMSADELLKEHKDAWKDILHTGLSISTTSNEPGIPDPRTINETFYYLLSSADSKLHDQGIPEDERRNLIHRLQTPEFCYHGNPTFHGRSLWTAVTSVEDVAVLQRKWSLTLSKNQCKLLISEGAEGLLQAILLSFGGLKFTENDLRLNMDPMVLHNDISFHQIIYRNDTLNISIKHAIEKETPVLLVSLTGRPENPLYACEAGCVHDPVELGMETKELPVYVTDPITAILYISHDLNHLKDLRDTIHVKKRVEHARHMKDVQKSSVVPTAFWIGVGSLIIFFHLFLVRLICNEYKSSYSTAKYISGLGSGNLKYPRFGVSRNRLES